MMENLPPYLQFDQTDLILVGAFFFTSLISLFFYLHYYAAPKRYAKIQSEEDEAENQSTKPSVSVIIPSSDAGHQLEQNLPFIMEQDYPNFEVIIVNDGSTDETDMVLKSFTAKYPNLYGTYLPQSNNDDFARNKLALTIGIKAAKNDVLLFVEPYCRPVSDKWISSMVSQISSLNPIVSGYSFLNMEGRKSMSRMFSFDYLMFCLKYMALMIKEKPYYVPFRNVAMRRQIFFDMKGFASVLNYEYGEKLFLSRIASDYSTKLNLYEDSFVEAVLDEEETYLWRENKMAYEKIKRYLTNKFHSIFSIETLCGYTLWVLWGIILVNSILSMQFSALGLVTLLGISLWVIHFLVLNKSSRLLKNSTFYLSLPFLKLFHPLWQLRFVRWRVAKSRK